MQRTRAGTTSGLRAVVLAVLLLSIGGCSIKLAYNNLDRLIRWQVSEFVDLTPEQRQYLVREIDAALIWHRRNHLPMYADFVDDVPLRFSDGVTPEMIEDVFEQLFAWGMEVQDRAMPAMVQTLRSLNDEQIADLPERMEESNLDLAEPESRGDLERHQDEWAEELSDSLSRFVGRLSAEQKTYIELRSKAYEPELALWADYRRRWQAELMRLLQDRNSEAFAHDFRQLLVDRTDYYGDEFTRVSEANEQISREVAAYVLSSLSEKQRDRFEDNLGRLAADFRKLAADV